MSVKILDLHKYKTELFPGENWIKTDLPGDPLGYVVVDLKNESEFAEPDSRPQNYHTLADHAVDQYGPFCKDKGSRRNFKHPLTPMESKTMTQNRRAGVP